jgi:phosphoesterase RecJ-like protein
MNNIDVPSLSKLILSNTNILLTTHLNPDGDAIGSVLGLYHYLKLAKKNARIIMSDPVPENLRFLTGVSEIELFNENSGYDWFGSLDLILILDLNEISRLKGLEKYILNSRAKKVVIDHHLEPKDFADFYLVDTDASSTGEMIYKIITQDKSVEINKSIAENLYAAILTDSGSFRFPRTDEEVHMIIADLIRNGADPVRIYEEIYNKNSFNKIRLLGRGYSNLELFFDGIFCLMTLRKEDFLATNTNNFDLENFVESLMAIDKVKIGVLLAEIPDGDEIKLSFRSKGNYSVRDLAMKFNGGGHLNASGARIQSVSLESVRKRLLEESENLFFKNNKE